MPGFLGLDSVIDYQIVVVISWIISVGAGIIGSIFIFIPLIVAVVRRPNTQKGKKRGRCVKIIVLSLFCILDILIILYGYDGRYKKQNISSLGGKKYFGTISNGQADGWGKMYDENNHLIYIGGFKNGKKNGEGIVYGYSERDWLCYEKLSGKFKNDKPDGNCVEYDLIEGELVVIYEGNYLNGEKCGQGEYYEYDDSGNKIVSYDGAWAFDVKWGYGVYTDYEQDEKNEEIRPKSRYSGTYVEGKMRGKGVWEYKEKGIEYVYVGYVNDGVAEGNGVLYGSDRSVYQEGYYKESELVEEKDLSYKDEYYFPEKSIWD